MGKKKKKNNWNTDILSAINYKVRATNYCRLLEI